MRENFQKHAVRQTLPGKYSFWYSHYRYIQYHNFLYWLPKTGDILLLVMYVLKNQDNRPIENMCLKLLKSVALKNQTIWYKYSTHFRFMMTNTLF